MTRDKYSDQISRDLKPVYTALSVMAAIAARDKSTNQWGLAYPPIKTLWLNAWEGFTPFLD